MLRRERINNTARRFKLQTLIQRYNTFQQYWQRICREIEAGTYRRHLIKAEKIGPQHVLTIAARRRFGKRLEPDQARASEPATATTPAISPPPEAARPAAEPAPRQAAGPPSPAAPEPMTRPKRQFEALDLDLDFGAPAPPKAAKPPAAPAPTPAPVPDPSPSAVAPPAPGAAQASQQAAAQQARVSAPAQGSAQDVKPAPAVGQAPRRPAAPDRAAAPASAVSVSEARVKELHARLLEAKRQTNDASQVSEAGLAKSLRAAESKLRERHGNRRIDFDVVIKDGKALVKPIIR
jgi:hypothetical protein